MYKYMITFSKTGVICYISHLDLMRFFNRTFRKTGIKLTYSQGFNPHPRMGFAQPLSLGYTGLNELMEFETEEWYETAEIVKRLSDVMPDGIDIKECVALSGEKKTLAARTKAAKYRIIIPYHDVGGKSDGKMTSMYLERESIFAFKQKKKKKEPEKLDIKPMIRDIKFRQEYDILEITTVLDSGSVSNLSPELIIDTVKDCFDIDANRDEIDVTREEIYFD